MTLRWVRILTILSAVTALDVTAQEMLREVEVRGHRPLKDIGVERTTIDSVALKENIALSMADILTYNSALFVKNHGRATLSTVSFRGTSPSHTQVTWNGMRINNPMLGMTDFSTIPSFFVDKAQLLHGTSSVNETGGALGGVVQLATDNVVADSSLVQLQYVQGIGSFRTFDEFFRATWSDGEHWSASGRFSYSSSPNDYKYVNHDKKENIYDDNHNIIGQYYPTERNRSGAFRDLNALGQVSYVTNGAGTLSLDLWYTNSNRELPVLTTDYGDERDFDNRQREQTFRGVLSWNMSRPGWSFAANAGYAYTNMKYDYSREITANNWAVMTRSRSIVNTAFCRGDVTWFASSDWIFTANVAGHQHFVVSRDKNVILVDGGSAIVGYDKARIELSGAFSAKWQPHEAIGLSATLRQEMFGNKTATVPAFFVDAMIWKPASLLFKASVSSNHKFPSLNDMYFLPGGNPNLKDETGLTYDLGMSSSFSSTAPIPFDANVSAGWFDSYINDWIIWLPTTKGFFSPKNVKKVHAYGIETHASLNLRPHRLWTVNCSASYSWTPSVNRGEPMSPADKSVGQQLPYVPRHSASLTARVGWRSWSLLYKWAFYSRRFTMSSGDNSITGNLPPYFMNNVVVQKDLYFKPLDIQLKLAVNNLFNEHYLSVLSHPMPGINFEFFITLIPHIN